MRFIDKYRSYVINYNLGKDLVRAYVEKQADARRRRRERWSAFARAAVLAAPALGPEGVASDALHRDSPRSVRPEVLRLVERPGPAPGARRGAD